MDGTENQGAGISDEGSGHICGVVPRFHSHEIFRIIETLFLNL
jgi:hypothetical protein